MKYLLMLAALMFTFGAPMADAAPKKSKKAKTTKKVKKDEDEDDVMSIEEYEEEQARIAQEEADAYAKRSGAERREETKLQREETKIYLDNQKKTLRILKKVRNEKSAAKVVKDLEEIYGEVDVPSGAAAGTSTALGTVVYLEETEENIPVHQASRATAAALNKAINKELKRIESLKIENAKFNAALKLMLDAQRQ